MSYISANAVARGFSSSAFQGCVLDSQKLHMSHGSVQGVVSILTQPGGVVEGARAQVLMNVAQSCADHHKLRNAKRSEHLLPFPLVVSFLPSFVFFLPPTYKHTSHSYTSFLSTLVDMSQPQAQPVMMMAAQPQAQNVEQQEQPTGFLARLRGGAHPIAECLACCLCCCAAEDIA